MPTFARSSFVLLAVLSLVAAASAAPKKESAVPAFVQRIQPLNFAETQRLFLEELTTGNSIVILQTNGGRPISALALNRQADGDFTVTLRAPPATPSGDWLTGSTTLPGSLGLQVERAIALVLNRHVLVAPNHLAPDDENIAVWLYQRLPGLPDAAGIIPWSALFDQPAARQFLDDLIGPLQRLGGADDAEREKLLQAIDLAVTKIDLTRSGP